MSVIMVFVALSVPMFWKAILYHSTSPNSTSVPAKSPPTPLSIVLTSCISGFTISTAMAVKKGK